VSGIRDSLLDSIGASVQTKLVSSEFVPGIPSRIRLLWERKATSFRPLTLPELSITLTATDARGGESNSQSAHE
jgi:hypothetical protein